MNPHKGHCIICHRDTVILSDEHVIPEAIGGYYHIYSVCKECNSKLGDHVDCYLTNHWLIQAARHLNHHTGYGKQIPNPLIGLGAMENGEKVRLEEDKDHKISVHFLPTAPRISEDRQHFSFSVDAKDEKEISKIADKMFKKMNLDPKKQTIECTKEIHEIEKPVITTKKTIDLQDYKIALLKIAYEFTVDRIPEYYNDPTARLYADILHKGNLEKIDEIKFLNDPLTNPQDSLIDYFFDSTINHRHILILFNANGHLYSCIKLYNLFCATIQMSDKSYEENELAVLINDFSLRNAIYYNSEDFAIATQKSSISYTLHKDAQEQLDHENKDANFLKDSAGNNILFDANFNIINTDCLLESITLNGSTKDIEDKHSYTTHYELPEGFFYYLIPSRQLLEVKTITIRTEFKKL